MNRKSGHFDEPDDIDKVGGRIMLTLSRKIVVNVEDSYIETYLRKKGHVRTEEQKAKRVEYWVNDLIAQKEIDIQEFEDFLYEELFFEKRKCIRIYHLDFLNKIRNPRDWASNLNRVFGQSELNFNSILTTIPSKEEPEKIAAITSETDYKGNLSKIQILLVRYAETWEAGRINETCSYYPIEIDLKKETMNIKAWNRKGLTENYKTEEYMDRIVGLLSSNFNVITRNYMSEHKKALHNMSQGIVSDLYNKIPAYNEIWNIEQESSEFEKKALEKLSLKHLGEQEEGSIPKYVFDFQEELKKVMEKLCICDYFYDVQHETAVWEMGVEMIVSKIKFQDIEHVLTIMSSESSQIPVFCTKTFLSLKKSLEDAKVVDRLWIEKSRTRGKLSLAYNAAKDEFLEIGIQSRIRFKREDLEIAEEIYNQYANGTVGEIKNQDQRNIV